jgi:hypothetical protein
MKKRNSGVIILSFVVLVSLIFFFNYVFAASQTVTIDTNVGEAGVFHNYTITVVNNDPRLNITQVSLALINITAAFNATSFGSNISAILTNTSSPPALLYSNSSISLIRNGTSALFWFYAETSQTGVFTINVSTLDNNSVINSSILSVTINDTVVPTISFVNQTPSNTASGLTDIPVNVSASDSGSGLKNITIYLSNSSGLVNLVTNTSSFYYDFSGLSTGTYNLWASAFDNANNYAQTSNLTLGVTVNSSACTPNWNISSLSTCVNGTQIKTWGDYNSCGVSTGQPAATNQSCTVNPTCVTSWTCTDWAPAVCASDNGTQTRTCTDSNGCSSPQVETRDCALGSAITTNNSTSQTAATSFSLSSAFFIVMGIIIISVVGVVVILMRLRKKSYSTDFGSKDSGGYKSFSPRSPPAGPPGFPNQANSR